MSYGRSISGRDLPAHLRRRRGLGAIVAVAITSIISVGAALLRNAFTKAPKQPTGILGQPNNDITKGGFLTQVIGRRIVGCGVGWVGPLIATGEPGTGGGKFGGKKQETVENFCSAWHQLCIGPMRRLYKIYLGESIIWDQTLDSTVVADGASYDVYFFGEYYGSFQIYFGRDAQTPNSVLTAAGVPDSGYPFCAGILWNPLNLIYASSFPPVKYEIETRISDLAAAASLDLTPLGSPDWIDEPTPTDGNVTVWLNGEQSIPAGTYTITYEGGALSYTADNAQWSIQPPVGLATGVLQFVNSSYGVVIRAPGDAGSYASQAAVQAANSGATTASFTWGGGVMGLQFLCGNYSACFPGAPNPTFVLELVGGGTPYEVTCVIHPGDQVTGASGPNGIAALYLLMCAPYPWGCGINPALIDATALACAAAQLAAELLVTNILIEDGKDASQVIASLMSDIGMLLPQVGGLLTPYLIRVDPTPPAITDDVLDAAGIEQDQQQAFFNPDVLTIKIADALFDFQPQDIHLDDDSQSYFNQRRHVHQVVLENVTDQTTAYTIGNRKQLEVFTLAFKVPTLTVAREARSPQFHPGRPFTYNGLPLRVSGWEPDMKGIAAKVESVLDQYGDISNETMPNGALFTYAATGSAPALPDLAFQPMLLPATLWPSPTEPVFVVPRVRANGNIVGASVWISTTSGGTYTQVGEQDAYCFGGTLTAAFGSPPPGTLATGPAFAQYNGDSSIVLDLSGSTAAYNAGGQALLVDSEAMYCGSITALGGGSWTPDELTRAEFQTVGATHAIGASLLIFQPSTLTQISTPIITENAGATLYVKTQPFTNSQIVDLSLVTPQPLVIPSSLGSASITLVMPANGGSYVAGSLIPVFWTSNSVNLVDILYSSNGGSTWTVIYSGAQTGTGGFGWNTTTWPATSTARIMVRDTSNNSTFAENSANFAITSSSAPSTPTGVSAAGSTQAVTVSWSAVAGATSYNISYSRTSGGPFNVQPAVHANTTSTSWELLGLLTGEALYFVVTACNATGESAPCSQVSATAL